MSITDRLVCDQTVASRRTAVIDSRSVEELGRDSSTVRRLL